MSRHRLSMSRMALARACSYGFRGDVEVVERPSGRAARIGVVVHAMVEEALTRRKCVPDEDPTILAEASAVFSGPLRGYAINGGWDWCEIGLRYDAASDTCSDGPRRGEPGYEDVGPMVLPGTLDLLRVEPDRIVLRDLKTGKPPTDREQLYAQAVAASRRFGRDLVETGYVRALKTKLEELDVEVLDRDRLDAEAGRIARVLRQLPSSEPIPGENYCWKCDARLSCPARQPDDTYREPEPPALLEEGFRLF